MLGVQRILSGAVKLEEEPRMLENLLEVLKTGRTEVQKMLSGALDLAVAHVEHLKTWRLELQKMLQGARSRLSATKNI